jgi:hypothetical protein
VQKVGGQPLMFSQQKKNNAEGTVKDMRAEINPTPRPAKIKIVNFRHQMIFR